MWRTTVVVVVVLGLAGSEFNEEDESDFADNDDKVSAIWVSDIVSTADIKVHTPDPKLQGEVEKLLRQSVFHYEEPCTVVISDIAPETTTTTSQSTVKPVRVSKFDAGPRLSEIRRDQVLTVKSVRSRARKRPWTSEAVYSVQVPQWDDDGMIIKPGIIESLVKAHDIVRYETRPPQLADDHIRFVRYEDSSRLPYETGRGKTNRTAYNDGGVRLVPEDPRRQALLIQPPVGWTPSASTRLASPVMSPRTTLYKFTRRTKKNPICTDSYYECLFKCFDDRGYRVRCPWDTKKKTRAPPRRMNITGLLGAVQQGSNRSEYDLTNLFTSWRARLMASGYHDCLSISATTTRVLTTTKKEEVVYYDNQDGGRIVTRCLVCGLTDNGIPPNTDCAESFGPEKSSFRRYCRYMSEVPLWFNRSDPYSVFGPWTGGCSVRWVDISGVYTQRTCRSLTKPAVGHHYLSRRMAHLELALKGVKTGCTTSPMATLVPFSRAISLYARMHVCVCTGNFCNQGSRREPFLVSLVLSCVLGIAIQVELV